MPFDPFTQNITLTASDGSTMNVSIPEFDEYVQEGVVSCINYGTQLGATMVTFVLLFLLTRAKKRSSIVFCLNILALFFNMFRLICQVLNYTGAFFEAYSYFSGDVSHASQGDFADSVLVQVANSLVETVMEASLVTQTKVVTTNMLRWQKLTVLAISVALAVVNIGFRLAQMAWCSVLIMRAQSFYPVLWLQKVNTVLMTVSICYFSVVLMGKLGYTIHRRRKLGVHQFGPMQIIFVMSCQTMIVPAIFSVLQFSSVNIHHINNDIVTFVVVFLPITTLWASTAMPGHASAQDLESGVPLWAKLSSARLDSFDSRQSRKKSVATSDTLPTFLSELNFYGSDPDRSCNKRVHLVESIRG